MSELELKLHGPRAALDSLADALRARGAQPLRLQARYFDTQGAHLARHLIALRLRLEGEHWVQTLKTAGDGAVHRQEHEVPVAGDSGSVPALDLHRHAGTPAGKALESAMAAAHGAGLAERHGTDIERLHCLIAADGGTAIEAALDIGSASAGARSVPVAELELEHKGGPVQGLFDLAAAWVRHGGLWLSTITKAERGQRLLEAAHQPAPRRATRARPPDLPADADGAALVRALLQAVLEQVLANASLVAESAAEGAADGAVDGAADGATDSDAIHQLRVGLRRLRTVLRELAALSPTLLPTVAPEWDGALSATFRKLGERRDQEAVAAAVKPLLDAAGAPLSDWPRRASAEPADAVRDPAFQTTLIAVLALAHAGDGSDAAVPAQAAKTLIGERLSALHRKVVRGGRRFRSLAPAEQHRVRKQLKRLRYLAELTAGLWPHGRVRRYLKRLGAAQDALGAHTDLAVASATFRDDAAAHPAAWFAAGYLQGRMELTARAAHEALGDVGGSKKFWV